MNGPPKAYQDLIEENAALKHKIQELQESESSYKMLFANAAEGILVAELQTKQFTYANPALCKMFGYTEEEMLQLGVEDIHPKGSLEYVTSVFDAQARDEKTCALNIPCLRKDGPVFFANISTASFVLNGAKCNVGFFTDVTERKQVEENLRDRDERLQTIFENVEEIIHMIAWDGTFLYISPSWERFTGFPVSGTVGKSFTLYVHPEDVPACLEVVKNVRETGQPHKVMEFRVRHASGKWIWFMNSGVAIKDAQGNPLYFMGVAMDITERKRVEDALQESEEKYRLLADKIPDIVFVLNLDLKTTYVSPSVQTMLGFSQEERMLQTVDQQLTPASLSVVFDTLARELALEKEGHGDPQRKIILELEYYHKDGSTRWTETIISAIRDENNVLTAIHGLNRDITARKQRQEERETLISELQKALSEVKTLSGLLPICTSCKKIRDDKGYWDQIESYVGKHSTAEFSHGVCPDCMKKLYPEINEEKKMKVTGKVVVLLVDDEEDFRMIFIRQMKRLLKDHELEFIEADNGEEALALLKSGVKPSIIILDYAMPKVDGMELLRRIDRDHGDLRDVPLVMISGYNREEIMSDAQNLRCAFFNKNMDHKIFYEEICRHMAATLGFSFM